MVEDHSDARRPESSVCVYAAPAPAHPQLPTETLSQLHPKILALFSFCHRTIETNALDNDSLPSHSEQCPGSYQQ